MPLIVPGVTTSLTGNDKTSDWQNKLMGKKLGEQSDQMVRIQTYPYCLLSERAGMLNSRRRLLQRRSCLKNIESSATATWRPWITNQRGTLCFVDFGTPVADALTPAD